MASLVPTAPADPPADAGRAARRRRGARAGRGTGGAGRAVAAGAHRRDREPARAGGGGAYAAGAVATFALSATYHLARDARRRARLRPFDHAAIFVIVAGDYTPFALVALPGAAGPALLRVRVGGGGRGRGAQEVARRGAGSGLRSRPISRSAGARCRSRAGSPRRSRRRRWRGWSRAACSIRPGWRSTSPGASGSRTRCGTRRCWRARRASTPRCCTCWREPGRRPNRRTGRARRAHLPAFFRKTGDVDKVSAVIIQ